MTHGGSPDFPELAANFSGWNFFQIDQENQPTPEGSGLSSTLAAHIGQHSR
jgi:hypothetical protein